MLNRSEVVLKADEVEDWLAQWGVEGISRKEIEAKVKEMPDTGAIDLAEILENGEEQVHPDFLKLGTEEEQANFVESLLTSNLQKRIHRSQIERAVREAADTGYSGLHEVATKIALGR